MKTLKDTVIRMLEDALSKMKADNSEMSEDQLLDIASALCHIPLSKAQSCRYLNMSRSQFDDHVRAREIPKGRKVEGYNELRWYRDELDTSAMILRNKKQNICKK